MYVMYFVCQDCGIEIASWDYRYEEYEQADVCPNYMKLVAEAI